MSIDQVEIYQASPDEIQVLVVLRGFPFAYLTAAQVTLALVPLASILPEFRIEP